MKTMGFIHSQNNQPVTKNKFILIPETFTHSIAFGETGAGKTTSFIYPNLQERISLGHGILLYDYKGKEHLSVKALAYTQKRLQDVLEIGKPWGEKINLVQNMDEDELDKFFDILLKHGDDNKYWQNSAKSLGQLVLGILNAIESTASSLEKVDGIIRETVSVGSLDHIDYPTKRTLKTLVEVCKTFESLKSFISNLNNLVKEFQKFTKKAARYVLADSGVTPFLSKQFADVIANTENLRTLISDNKNLLNGFGEDSNENLTQNIIGTLIAPLMSLAKNENFNTNDFDITQALGKGKIIIINVEALSNATIESLNSTILYELSKRTRSTHIHPVSIFIDEVQRVVSANTDLPIDVFREAKVDLFLATQNSALLKEKLKEEKFNALMGNLTQKFYYRSSTDEELESQLSLKDLNAFEYLCSSSNDYYEVHRAKGVFLDKDKLILIEFRYQKYKKVLDYFLYQHANEQLVLAYDARLYKRNKVIAIDIKTKKERILNSLNKENIDFLELEVLKLFRDTLSDKKDRMLGKIAA